MYSTHNLPSPEQQAGAHTGPTQTDIFIDVVGELSEIDDVSGNSINVYKFYEDDQGLAGFTQGKIQEFGALHTGHTFNFCRCCGRFY